MSTGRYQALFDALAARDNEGAFVPFVMLGDPTPEISFDLICTMVDSGADALELGIPFSDPVADGPTIQAAHIRALDAGVDVDQSLGLVRRIRDRYPDLPIGLLIYGNVAFARGTEQFYADVAASGADSVLLPDIPVREGEAFAKAAEAAGVDPIFIAPPHATPETLSGVARLSKGYVYAVSRLGVTGTERASSTDGLEDVVSHLASFGGPPSLLGFGISTPEHVSAAVNAGAAGAISGSAITKVIEKHCVGNSPNPRTVGDLDALKAELGEFVASMKGATKRWFHVKHPGCDALD